VTGCANRSPTAADAIEDEVQEAFAICGGDAIAALRITLIANAFPEAEIDRLSAAVSSGFARGKVRKARRPKEGRRGQPPDGWSGALRGQGGSGGHLDPQPAHDQKLK
jgi:hypothetical protein